MAKIEMDLSEYESIMENKKLLKESLEKERLLQVKIEELNKEKLTALEDAKMKVIKVVKHEKREYIYQRCSDEMVYRNILNFLNIRFDNFQNFQFGSIDNLIERIFTKTLSHNIPIEEITTCGLDEVKSEIRKSIENSMNDDLKNFKENNIKLNEIVSNLKKDISELKLKNNDLTNDISNLKNENNALIDERNNLVSDIEFYKNSMDKIGMIEEIVKDGYGFFDKSNKLDSIIKILN